MRHLGITGESLKREFSGSNHPTKFFDGSGSAFDDIIAVSEDSAVALEVVFVEKSDVLPVSDEKIYIEVDVIKCVADQNGWQVHVAIEEHECAVGTVEPKNVEPLFLPIEFVRNRSDGDMAEIRVIHLAFKGAHQRWKRLSI